MPHAIDRVRWTPALDAALAVAYLAGGLSAAVQAMGFRRSPVKNRVKKLGLKRPPRLWSATEDATLREKYPQGKTAPELAAELGRTLPATKRRIHKLGLDSGRIWTPEEIEIVRSGYGDRGCKSLARELLGGDDHEALKSVYALAFRLGVTTAVRHPTEVKARLVELHAAGLSDRRIGEEMADYFPAVNRRERVTALRNRLGLPRVVEDAETIRIRGRAGRLKQMATATNPRSAAHRRLAVSYGLPADTPARATEIVVTLASGPMSREQLKTATGKDPCDVWNALGTSYLGGLVARGLVAKSGKPATYFLTPLTLDLLAKGGNDARP